MSPVGTAKSSWHPCDVDVRVLAFICLMANLDCTWKLFLFFFFFCRNDGNFYFFLTKIEGSRMMLPGWNAISFSGCAPVAASCCFFGAFLVEMILLVSRTPSAFGLIVFLPVLCPGDSALSSLPCDLVSLCLLWYGLTCIYALPHLEFCSEHLRYCLSQIGINN